MVAKIDLTNSDAAICTNVPMENDKRRDHHWNVMWGKLAASWTWLRELLKALSLYTFGEEDEDELSRMRRSYQG